MDNPKTRILDELSEIRDLYLNSDEVDTTLPVTEYIRKFRESVNQNRSVDVPNVRNWFQQVDPVVDDIPTAELEELFQELEENQAVFTDTSSIGWGILTLATVMIECRHQVNATPIDSVTSRLQTLPSLEKEDQWEVLSIAVEEASKIVRSTAVTMMTLDRISEIDFQHPDENEESVSQDIRDAHANRREHQLKQLAFASDRSKRGEWTEDDLLNYTDEAKSGEPFEQLIAELWSDEGFETDLTAAGSDGGVDVIATNGEEDLLIQAKRYESRRVSAAEIRELAGLMPQYEFDRALLVTSSGATTPAEEEAARVDKLELITGSMLAKRLTESDLQPPVSIQIG